MGRSSRDMQRCAREVKRCVRQHTYWSRAAKPHSHMPLHVASCTALCVTRADSVAACPRARRPDVTKRRPGTGRVVASLKSSFWRRLPGMLHHHSSARLRPPAFPAQRAAGSDQPPPQVRQQPALSGDTCRNSQNPPQHSSMRTALDTSRLPMANHQTPEIDLVTSEHAWQGRQQSTVT